MRSATSFRNLELTRINENQCKANMNKAETNTVPPAAIDTLNTVQ